jgi:hypothetical protein
MTTVPLKLKILTISTVIENMQALTKFLRLGGYRLCHLSQTYYYSVAIFCLSALIFYLILTLPVVTDIQYHVSILQNWINGRSILPATFLYYLTIYAVAFFQNNSQLLLIASAFILAASVTLKFIITRKIIYDSIKESEKIIYSWHWISIFSLLLILAFSLPAASNNPNWIYIGQIPPNVWHNSTTIFLMPFALLLFWSSYKQLVNPQNNRIWVLLLL